MSKTYLASVGATIYRDHRSLTTELAMERAMEVNPSGLVPINQEG